MMSFSSVSNFFVGICRVVAHSISSICSSVTTAAFRVFSQINTTFVSKPLIRVTQQPPVASSSLVDPIGVKVKGILGIPKGASPAQAFAAKYSLAIQGGDTAERAFEVARAEAFAARYSAAIEGGLGEKKALEEATAIMEAGFTQAQIFEAAMQIGATQKQATDAAEAFK